MRVHIRGAELEEPQIGPPRIAEVAALLIQPRIGVEFMRLLRVRDQRAAAGQPGELLRYDLRHVARLFPLRAGLPGQRCHPRPRRIGKYALRVLPQVVLHLLHLAGAHALPQRHVQLARRRLPRRRHPGLGTRHLPPRRRGDEAEALRQRGVVPGHLHAIGVLHHRRAHPAHHLLHVQPGRADIVQDGAGEGAVAATPVAGGIARLGRVRDQRIGRRGADLRQPLCHRQRPGRPRPPGQVGGQRVVAAGIQEHQGNPRHVAQQLEQLRHVQRLPLHGAVIGQGDIHRQQVVAAIHLHAMPGVEHHGHVGAFQRAAEIPHSALHAGEVGVVGVHHGEASGRQRAGHVHRVVHRVGQGRRLLVGRGADDQRHPLFRPGRQRQQQPPQQHQQHTHRPAPRPRPPQR